MIAWSARWGCACCLLSALGILAGPLGEWSAAQDKPESSRRLKPGSPLASEPTTSPELFEATLLMADIARYDLAKAYLEQLSGKLQSDADLLALRDQFGPGAFLRLNNIPDLQPGAGQLVDRMNRALRGRTIDPARVALLVRGLSGSFEQRRAAQDELRASGAAIVPALISILDDPSQQPHHEVVLNAIVSIGAPAVPVLTAALESDNPALRGAVCTALGAIGQPDAIPYLWYPALGDIRHAGVTVAAREALARLLGTSRLQIDAIESAGVVERLWRLASQSYHVPRGSELANRGGVVPLWIWDERARQPVLREFPRARADDLTGARFARQALLLAPSQPRVQEVYLGLALGLASPPMNEGVGPALGPDTAFDLALSLGPDVLERVLADALKRRRADVAFAALRALAQTATVHQLRGSRSRSPIAQALTYPDLRVQFAAAVTVLQIDPPGSVPEAPRVIAILRRALVSESKPTAVVIDPLLDRAGVTGAILNELGFQPLVVSSGREGFQLAADRLDVELVVLHAQIIRWPLSQTLANLKADSRTASLPVIVLGGEDLRGKLEALADSHESVMFTADTQVTRDLERQVRRFLDTLRTPPLTEKERTAQQVTALAWLARLAEKRRTKTYELVSVEKAVSELGLNPEFASPAVTILGEIASRGSQESLARMALDAQVASEVREQAAQVLTFHIQRFGLLLGSVTLTRLHAVAAAERDPVLHAAFAGLIGTLQPDTALVGARLKSAPSRPR